MINIPHLIESRKVSYAKIPLLIRIIILTASIAISLVGFILVLTPPPFFDLGAIVLLFSLSVLSLQFSWAHRLLIYIDTKLRDKMFRKRLFTIVTIIFISIIALAYYGHIRI